MIAPGKMLPEEKEALEHSAAVYGTIRGWGLKYNGDELAHAVHTIQFFIAMHELARLDPENWANWYEH